MVATLTLAEVDELIENRQNHARLKTEAVDLLAAATRFQDRYDALVLTVKAEDVVSLDAQHTQLINGLKTRLGIV